jgi:hypothetical protein
MARGVLHSLEGLGANHAPGAIAGLAGALPWSRDVLVENSGFLLGLLLLLVPCGFHAVVRRSRTRIAGDRGGRERERHDRERAGTLGLGGHALGDGRR